MMSYCSHFGDKDNDNNLDLQIIELVFAFLFWGYSLFLRKTLLVNRICLSLHIEIEYSNGSKEI